jgi:hypothetical protein
MDTKRTKKAVLEGFIDQTLLADIESTDTPDPVPVVEASGETLEQTETFDAYRKGRGSGNYVYMFYLLEDRGETPTDIRPVYIGETDDITGRLRTHFNELCDALPISGWEDDGSRASFSKYDHMATVYSRTESPFCVWITDVDERDHGPYGYPIYREELEAQLVGLVQSHPQFNRILANRDFVPNRVTYQREKEGPKWMDLETEKPGLGSKVNSRSPGSPPQGQTKDDLWHNWIEQTVCRDINDPEAGDPLPLFETIDNSEVKLKESGSSIVLQRSEGIDARIRQEANRCVYSGGVKDDGPHGLLYMMYQLADSDPTPTDIILRYIGKAEAYGTENELSNNFTEIAYDHSGTRQFARWGDGKDWHIGKLSRTIFGDHKKKLSWASELFVDGTHQLTDQVYLWVRAWDPEEYPCPYGYQSYLAEVEGLLIGLAYTAYPDKLLNQNGVPDWAPANNTPYKFSAVSDVSLERTNHELTDDFE